MPRQVPGALRARILFGGGPTLIGLGLMAFMQIFGWIFVPMLDVRSLWEWDGTVVGSSGTVVAVRPTNTRVNRRTVMAIDFQASDGRTGTSYTTGLVPGPGRTVSLEEPAGHPDHLRIAGMTRSPMPAWVVFILAPFLVVGLVFIAVGLLRARRRLALLENGRLAQATFVGSQKTNIRVNHQPLYKLRYRFVTEEGREVVRSPAPRAARPRSRAARSRSSTTTSSAPRSPSICRVDRASSATTSIRAPARCPTSSMRSRWSRSRVGSQSLSSCRGAWRRQVPGALRAFLSLGGRSRFAQGQGFARLRPARALPMHFCPSFGHFRSTSGAEVATWDPASGRRRPP